MDKKGQMELKLVTAYDLVATDIYFTRHAVVYKVKCEYDGITGLIATMDDIKNKDLFLKTTMYDPTIGEVSFAPVNMIAAFYQGILEGTLKNADEHEPEKKDIYAVGEVIGKVVV